VVDENSFMEIHKDFAKNVVVGFARIKGESVGLVCNQPKVMAGGLDINSSDKASRFIRTCDSFNIPIITFEDVTGFFPGIKQEHGGIIRHGAKILFAYSEATVPKLTIILRKAYGGAYVALNSKSIGADLVFAWPNAEIAVMGPQGAANIIFAREIQNSENPELVRQQKIDEYRDKFANPYVAASRGMVDDVIDPRETRIKIIQALEMMRNKIEDAMTNENREAVIRGNILPPASKIIKLAITTGLAWVINPALAVITLLGTFAMNAKIRTKERQLILDELDVELVMVDKYIRIAEEKNDMKNLRELLKIKKKLQNQEARLKYKMNFEWNQKTPNSLKHNDDED
jgi:acetyl-CoA carboxylase beta subunit